MDPLGELSFRPAGAPARRALGRPPGARDIHRLALALGARALHERGGLTAGDPQPWHVVPLHHRGTLSAREGQAELRWEGLGAPRQGLGPRALDRLRWLLEGLAAPRPEPALEHAGGLSVVLSYDLAHEIERLPCTTEDRDGLPWLFAIAAPACLLVHAVSGETELAWLPDAGDLAGSGPSDLAWGLRPEELSGLERSVERALRRAASEEVLLPAGGPAAGPAGELRALTSPEEHAAMVEAVIGHLHAGDLYQANVALRFEQGWEGSLLPLSERLHRKDPSPHAGFLLGPGFELACNSPERMVRLQGEELLTEPIGGTRPLPDELEPAELARLAEELESSAKDRAEHVMLVDIHRNDLGRVARPGSLHVPRMMRLDRRRHVLQAVAEIRARLAAGKGPVDVIEAMLPAGCITGVPKVRTMQVLDGLEAHRRGFYTGSFGRITSWGDLDLNVLIRSAWCVRGRLAFQAGGGIVLGSTAEAEHAECLAKAAAMMRALAALAPLPRDSPVGNE